MTDREVSRQMARKTRRSLLVGGGAALTGGAAWKWLRSRRDDDELPWPLRIGLRIDEQVARDYFRGGRLARTFPLSAVETGRFNGDLGLNGDVADGWRLSVGDLSLSLEEIKALPRTEMVTELKCIEGWSRILQWGGVRFRDFVQRYASDLADPDGYASLETPDGAYYVGLDMPSALHPQTLLCYEMNGKPLESQHGAPLRLVIPVKYGIKNLKRIGKINFGTVRPPDYWAENGYDWYAGF
jgi:hypothetical protein